MGTTWEDRKTTGNKLSCDHKEQKQKACHEHTEHKNQLQQNGGRQDLRDLGEIWATLGCSHCPGPQKNLPFGDRTSRMTRQTILIPVTRAGSEVTFLRISGRSVTIPHPFPRTPSQQAWRDLFFIAFGFYLGQRQTAHSLFVQPCLAYQ